VNFNTQDLMGLPWSYGVVFLGYLVGSFPTAYLVGRWGAGVDIRTVGSRNMGATNVFRVVGRAAGFFTLFVDIAKGYLVVMLALWCFGGGVWPLLTGVAAVAGHTWSVWVRFRGGKGVATSAGVFLALLPGPMGAGVLAFLVAFLFTRRVSVGSILGAIVLPLSAWFLHKPLPLVGVAVVLSAVVIGRHVPNIKRLLRGEEPAVF